MATDPGTIDFLLDQLGTRATGFTTKRMFGEYCLYRDGTPIALVCDDTLFVKDTPAGRDAMATITDVAFGPPYPGARLHLRLPPDLWDDGDALRRLLDATAAALPPPRPKKSSSAAKAAGRTGSASKRADAAAKPIGKATTTAAHGATADARSKRPRRRSP